MRLRLPLTLSAAIAVMSGPTPSFDDRTVELLTRNARELCIRSWELGTLLETMLELYRASPTLRLSLSGQIPT